MTKAETDRAAVAASLAIDYYQNQIQHKPDLDKRTFFRNAAAAGLTADALYAAIDYAVSRCGFGRYERDYWPLIQHEARRIWKEARKKPPP